MEHVNEHDIFLPEKTNELLFCNVNWGQGLWGLRLNCRLQRVICLDCSVSIGIDNDVTKLKKSMRTHRRRKKHAWPIEAVDDFLSTVA